jgi:IPT/TIG domain
MAVHSGPGGRMARFDVALSAAGRPAKNTKWYSCPPAPSVTSLSPASATAGGSQFLLTVNGDDFRRDSAVNWNGSFVVTSFANTHQLFAVHPCCGHRTVRLGVGFCVQFPGGRHDLCLRWDRSDVHYLVPRQELQCRSLRDQLVRGASIRQSMTRAKAVSAVVEKFREKYGAKDVKKHCSEFDVSVLVNSTLSGSESHSRLKFPASARVSRRTLSPNLGDGVMCSPLCREVRS